MMSILVLMAVAEPSVRLLLLTVKGRAGYWLAKLFRPMLLLAPLLEKVALVLLLPRLILPAVIFSPLIAVVADVVCTRAQALLVVFCTTRFCPALMTPAGSAK